MKANQTMAPSRQRTPGRRITAAAAALALFGVLPAQADLILHEPFDYGETGGNLVGMGGSETGFDSADKWGAGTVTASYNASGLELGSGATTLDVSGGRADINSNANTQRAYRQISVDQTGQIWGSYLWVHNVGTSYSGVGISSSTSGNENTGIDFMSLGKRHNSDGANVRIGTGVSSTANANATGINYTKGTTYLVLFTVTGLGDGTAQSQSMKQWMLTSEQFDHFKDAGLTEAALDAASTGTAAENVLNRATLATAAGTAGMTSLDYVILGQNPNGTQAQYDEIRISNTSLDEATPVVEDTTPPVVVGFSPEGAGANIEAPLVITFDKNVNKGTGSIVIKDSSDNTIDTIDVSSGQVTVSGVQVTISLSVSLGYSTGYYVLMDAGAIAYFDGITDPGTWSFTTRDEPPPLFLYEPFDYGASDIEDVNGLGGSETGFSSGELWVNNAGPDADYAATGLTIGSGSTVLTIAGGRFNVSNGSAQNVTVTRGIDVAESGTIFGSYLWRTTSVRGDNRNISWVGISGGGGNQGVTAGDFAAMADRWGVQKVGAALDSETAQDAPEGPAWSLDETYLVLFKVTNLGGGGDQTIKLWMLTSDQFDTHKASGGGLTESELDAAATGTDPDQVLERVSLTETAGSDLTVDDFLVLGAFQEHVADFDEIRLSALSLDAVTPTGAAPPTVVLAVGYDGTDLTLTWNSRSGRVYDLLSATGLAESPDTWGVWDGNEGISATPDQNTLTIARPGDGRRFFAVAERVLPPETLLSEGFDGVTPPALPGTGDPATSWQGGSDGVAGTVWDTGTPSTAVLIEPDGAVSAPYCAGTGVGENYGTGLSIWLRTPELGLDSYAGYSDVTLTLQQHRDIETGDAGSIRIVQSDGTLISEIEAPFTGADTEWQSYEKVITPAAYPDVFLSANNPVRIEFRFESDAVGGDPYAGFYLDDVEVNANP